MNFILTDKNYKVQSSAEDLINNIVSNVNNKKELTVVYNIVIGGDLNAYTADVQAKCHHIDIDELDNPLIEKLHFCPNTPRDSCHLNSNTIGINFLNMCELQNLKMNKNTRTHARNQRTEKQKHASQGP